ncbi:hypothetical protein EBS80_02140 [bacterium]|nr:hypothetical protein [bacterium]
MRTYTFSPIGWSKWLFGPFFLGTGSFLAFQFFIAASRGQLGGEWFMIVLSAAFFLATAAFLVAGAWMIESDRNSWMEDGAWHTTRGAIPLFHKRHARSAVEQFFVEKEPAIAVFGNRASVVGWRYHLKARLVGRKRPVRIAFFANEENANSALSAFTEQVR